MTYDGLLINTCTIQRRTSGGTDAYGQPVYVWNAIHTNIDCRHISGKGKEIKVGQETHVIYDQLFVKDIDVTVWDRVIIDGLTYNIVDVVFRQDSVNDHHKECYLERVE